VARRSDSDPPQGVPPGVWLYLQAMHPDEAAERGALIGKVFKAFATDPDIDLSQVHRAVIRGIEDRVWAGQDRRLRWKRQPSRAAARLARKHLKAAAAALRELVTLNSYTYDAETREKLTQQSDDELIDHRGVLTLFLDTRRPAPRGGRPVALWRGADDGLKQAGLTEHDRRHLLALLGLRDEK